MILISLDTLRADRLGVYGHELPTSPALDAFAREAVVFERAVAPAPNTPPSQASMMTSVYPGRHGFTGEGDRLPERYETLATLLQREGLSTAGFVDGGYLSAAFGFDRGFDSYDDEGGGFATILPKAQEWLASEGDSPFFLFLHTYDIHAPYAPPEPFRGMFHEEPYSGGFEPTARAMWRVFQKEIELDDEDRRHVELRYDEGIRYVDSLLGGFLDFLRAEGRLRDSIVIITSDHGEEFGEFGSYLHWQLYYEPILRIPLIVHVPGATPRGGRAASLVELTDILPTALELLGLPAHPDAQGRSLAPWFRGAQLTGPERIALAWPPQPETMSVRSMIWESHQLRFHVTGPARPELHDLDLPLAERKDLSATQPELVGARRELGELLLRENEDLQAPTPGEVDEDLRKRLEALGYVK